MSADDFTVTPWNVSGKIDYEKLTKRFGTEKMTHAMLDKMRTAAGEDHFMLRRGVFFSHRDLGEVLDAYGRGEKFFMYTGRGPSGHTHIGHLLPWVFAKTCNCTSTWKKWSRGCRAWTSGEKADKTLRA